MERVEALLGAVEELSEELDADGMEPDATRGFGSSDEQDRVQAIFDGLHERVLTPLGEALAELEDDVQRGALSARVAFLAAEVAVLRYVSGDRKDVAPLLDRAIRIAPEGALREEMQAYLRDPDTMVLIARARWLQRHEQYDAADRVAKQARAQAKIAVLQNIAKKLLETPRPIIGAPALSTYNGVGTMVYGERDRDDHDGSYVTTHWVTVLFVPIFPLGAYRVLGHGGGAYTFLAKERLGPVARAWRALLVVAAVCAIPLIGWSAYTNTSDYKIGTAIDAAAELERDGEVEHALMAYESALWEYTGRASSMAIEPAAVAIVRLTSASVPEPMTVAGVEEAARVVRRFEQLPPDARQTNAAGMLAERLVAWADQIGTEDLEASEASFRLLTMAGEISDDGEVSARRASLGMTLAGILARDWPLFAAEHYATLLPNADAAIALGELLRGLLDSPSLILEVGHAAERFTRERPAAMAGLAGEVSAVLEEARAIRDDAALQAAIESGDPAALAEAFERHPGNHDVVAALAALDRSEGRLDEAIARIEAVGPPGLLSTSLMQTLASCYAEAGRAEEAEAILHRYVAVRLPELQRAQAAFARASSERVQELTEEAMRPYPPADLERLLRAAPPEQHQAIFDQWLQERLRADDSLADMRREYERRAVVVPAVLELGTLKLRRANGASGDEREAILAEAERLFLSIRQEAAGMPSFHLGLGQVYYRLGRDEDGERELGGLLERDDDPLLALAVARAYRELGMVGRGREIATGVYEGGTEPARGHAAVLLSLMAATLEDQEMWLERAPQDQSFVQLNLLSIRARRLLREGQEPQAADLYAQVAARWEETAEHDAASANNAALAHQDRYYCTGDVADLTRAVRGLEAALRMQPDEALTLGNLAAVQDYFAYVKLLDRWVRTRMLRLGASEAEGLLGALADGPLREEVLAAFDREPAHRRAAELTAQEQVLAPQRGAAWSRERGWHVLRVDVAGLRELLTRLERVQRLDTTAEAEQWERWSSGADDERFRADGAAALEMARVRAEGARASGHAPTIAAALYLLAEEHVGRWPLTRDVADLETAAELYREAGQRWPELAVSHGLARALIGIALERAAGEDAGRLATLEEQRRRGSLDLSLHELSQDPAWRDALRARPELAEAATILRAHPSPFPSVTEWIVGRAAGDAELVAISEPSLAREEVRTSLEIRLRLSGAPEDHRRRLALLR